MIMSLFALLEKVSDLLDEKFANSGVNSNLIIITNLVTMTDEQ